MNTVYSPEKRAEVFALAQTRMGRNEIARVTGVPRSTVFDWMHEDARLCLPAPGCRCRNPLVEGDSECILCGRQV